MMQLRELVQVAERLFIRLGGKSILADADRDFCGVEGHFSCLLRERGRLVPGSRREGKNVWTITGREFLSQLIGYQFDVGGNPSKIRDDRLLYFGLGAGSQPEVAAVTNLASPVEYQPGLFLRQAIGSAFPTSPNTSIELITEYGENEISIGQNQDLREAGLFTDGEQSTHQVGGRDRTLANAMLQSPCAYRTFEPLIKTTQVVLEVRWEVRFR